ncbi:MAG: hypothetical protein AAF213_09315 [Pseudomonadota bacterium]
MAATSSSAEQLANSSRVLNLYELTRRRARAMPPPPMDDGDQPGDLATDTQVDADTGGDFFLNDTLNEAVIIKHRLNDDDRRRMLNDQAIVGTKIFVRYGGNDSFDESGKFMFMGQKDSAQVFQEHFGLDAQSRPDDARDLGLLTIIDRLPSLDPFLLRDRLMQSDYQIDPAYFRLSEAEAKRYRTHVIREFYPLAQIAFRNATDVDRLSSLIVDKMWEATDLKVLKPMMDAMEIPYEQSNDIFFSWKGFVYYKLTMQRLADGFAGFITSLQAAKPINMPTNIVRQEIEALRPRLIKALREEYETASQQIEEYDHAYRHQMIRLSKPQEFTKFLRFAPRRFEKLGASVAGIEHAQSTWKRRFGSQFEPVVPGQEFLEILKDYAEGLMLR